MMNKLSEAFARAEANFDNTLAAIQHINTWDRANAAARAHPIKGPALRLLDGLSNVITHLKIALIRS
jgi:hypothetical protein